MSGGVGEVDGLSELEVEEVPDFEGAVRGGGDDYSVESVTLDAGDAAGVGILGGGFCTFFARLDVDF